MNPDTGVWTFAANLEQMNETEIRRKKRQIREGIWGQEPPVTASLRGLSIDVQWFNFDAISTQTCIVKVRLFQSSDLSETQQIHYSGQVTVVTEDSNGYRSMSRNRVQTDTYDNGYCMVLPCSSSRDNDLNRFHGYIFADYNIHGNTEELIPVSDSTNDGLNSGSISLRTALNYELHDNKIKVDFDERLVHQEGLGPYYDYDRKWRYSSACSGASFEHNHFRFYSDYTCYDSYDTQDIVITEGNADVLMLNLLLWKSFFSYSELNHHFFGTYQPFKACYVKVKAPRGTKLQATSFISDEGHPLYGSETTMYGWRQDCVTDAAVCLEVRSPLVIGTSGDDLEYWTSELTTMFSIRTVDVTIPVRQVTSTITDSTNLADDVIPDDIEFKMYLNQGDNYNPNFGIYCKFGDTESEAQQALDRCKNGDESQGSRDDTTAENWAVEFGYDNSCSDSSIPAILLSTVGAIVVDQAQGHVFGSNVFTNQILKFSFNSLSTGQIIYSGADVYAMAYDKDADHLYFGENHRNDIMRINSDGTDVRYIIVGECNNYWSLTLDTINRYLYFGCYSVIKRSDMTGSNIIDLQTVGVSYPNELVLNADDDKLYWVDNGLNSVSVMDTDGSNYRVIYTATNGLNFFRSMVIINDLIYISERDGRTIEKVPLSGAAASITVYATANNVENMAEICVSGSFDILNSNFELYNLP